MLGSRWLFGTNGIRGVVNKELTPQMEIKIGGSIGTFFQHGNLIVEYDARTSGPMFVRAVIAGLNVTGCNVLARAKREERAVQLGQKYSLKLKNMIDSLKS
ncbi:hypothetical protein KAI31_02745 [Candidatus Bathyarchaeota archaeon]|nr:hypothetical protein [Candidatus Bathyarchaeota archaeon]